MCGSRQADSARVVPWAFRTRGRQRCVGESEAQKIAASVLQGAPGAITNSKRLLEELWTRSFRDDIEIALHHHMNARESAEAKEGIRAFNEKRPPNWVK